MDFDPQHPRNEVAQIIVELPQYSWRKSNFILIKEEGANFFIANLDKDRHQFSSTDVVAHMCSKRAPHTVRGGLILNGKKIKPQKYLQAWRSVEPIAITELEKVHGLKIIVTLTLDVERERQKRWNYFVGKDDPTLKSFDEFETKYGERFCTVVDSKLVTATFDLVNESASLDLEQLGSNLAYSSELGRTSSITFELVETNVDRPIAMVPELVDQFDMF